MVLGPAPIAAHVTGKTPTLWLGLLGWGYWDLCTVTAGLDSVVPNGAEQTFLILPVQHVDKGKSHKQPLHQRWGF